MIKTTSEDFALVRAIMDAIRSPNHESIEPAAAVIAADFARRLSADRERQAMLAAGLTPRELPPVQPGRPNDAPGASEHGGGLKTQ